MEGESAEEATTDQEVFLWGGLSNFLQVKQGNLCMVAPASGVGPITQAPCASNAQNWWKIMPAKNAPGYFTIQNGNRCLDVPGGVIGTNVLLQTFPCNLDPGQSNQQFQLNRTAGGAPAEFQIQPKLGPGFCLDIQGGGTNTGAPLQLFPCKTSGALDNQRFKASPYATFTVDNAWEDCDNDEYLTLRWLELGSTRSMTLFSGDLGHFPARQFAWGCDEDPDDLFTCPANTNWVEISRLYQDEFRIKCTL